MWGIKFSKMRRINITFLFQNDLGTALRCVRMYIKDYSLHVVKTLDVFSSKLTLEDLFIELKSYLSTNFKHVCWLL